MKIKRMIILLFIFLSLIPLSVLGVTNMLYYNGKLEKLLENDLKVAVSTQVRSIENFFGERRTDGAIISDLAAVRRLLKGEGADWSFMDQELVELLNLRVETSGFLDRIMITDTHFNVAVSNDGTKRIDGSLKQLDASSFGDGLRMTHVTGGENGEKKYIAAVQRIMDGRQVLGYLIMEVNLDFFERIRISAKLFNNGTVYMVDQQGQLIAAGDTVAPRRDYVLSGEELNDFRRAWSERDPQARIGILRYKALGEHYMSCYIEMEDPEWRVLSSVNIDQVLGYRRSVYDLTVMIFGTLLILLILVNYFMRRYFAAPVQSMISKFQRIKTTGDYSIRMDQTGDNEISVVSKEINSLLESMELHLNQQKEEKEKLRTKAERDLMTGLYNKETMSGLLRGELEWIKSGRVPVACLFLDIDDFKDFNTQYGHLGGDQVLRFVAQILAGKLPGIAGRQGGDEFIVVLSGEENIRDLEDRIRDMIQVLNEGVKMEMNGEQASIRCSIGVVIVSDGDIAYDELIARSDEVMYAVKQNHKNGYLIDRR